MELINKQTQEDHVVEDQGMEAKARVVQVNLPGIRQLHLKPISEIAQALTVALKSQDDIVELRYRIGEYISLTVR